MGFFFKRVMYDIGVIGIGKAGGEIATSVARRCNNLYLYNRNKETAKLKRRELLTKGDVHVLGSLEEILKKPDIIIISAGKHDPIRENAFGKNKGLIKEIGEIVSSKRKRNDNLYIVFSNPVDELCYVFYKNARVKKENVLGANHIDCLRFRLEIYERLKSSRVKMKDIKSFVVGPHSDLMVPVFSRTTIKGKDFYELGFSEKDIKNIENGVKFFGPNQIRGGMSSTRISSGEAMGDIIDVINEQKGYVCMSYLHDLVRRKTFSGRPLEFKGLDALPLKGTEELTSWLDKDEWDGFDKAFEHSIEFLENNH